MDGSADDFATRGQILLSQLDLIFDCDPLIDELGFIHPSQLSNLHSSDDSKLELNNPSGFTSSSRAGDEPHFRADCSRKTEHGVNILDNDIIICKEENGHDELPYDTTAFWCGEHKLAISMLALGPMYKCANAAFTLARTDYKKLLQAEQGTCVADRSQNSASSDVLEVNVFDRQGQQPTTTAGKVRLEDRLMSYTRALVLINCDHATAWNTRKQIMLSNAANQEALTRELHLAGVVLSCGPKSEEAWAYRRWVINQMVAGGVSRAKLDSTLDSESKLVEVVAGKSLMNYRAWRHRCWLVSQMSFLQVAIELHKTKQWAASHIADNCCFHYRRCLLLQLIKSKLPESNQLSFFEVTALQKELDMKSLKAVLVGGPEMRVVWKDEMEWVKNLIQRYIGRESLWIHLRFLFFSWAFHLGPSSLCPYWKPGPDGSMTVPLEKSDALLSMESELHFVDYCLHECSSDLTVQGDRQREFAATYKLWVLTMAAKQPKENGRNGCHATDATELMGFKQFLYDAVPHRQELWDGLLFNSDTPF